MIRTAFEIEFLKDKKSILTTHYVVFTHKALTKKDIHRILQQQVLSYTALYPGMINTLCNLKVNNTHIRTALRRTYKKRKTIDFFRLYPYKSYQSDKLLRDYIIQKYHRVKKSK